MGQLDQRKVERIDQLMNVLYENWMFNGCVLVIENGEPIYKEAFGLSDKENKNELTIDSAFYLASVSKQFTAMSIMLLENQGKLSFEDSLSKHFPQFPEYADDINIDNLLTHTSGIPDHFRLGAYKADLTNAQVLELLLEQREPNFKPGEKYEYSNGNYVLLSLITEKVSGEPFHSFLSKKIFEPLEMNRTLVFDESKPHIENRAIGYNRGGGLDDYEILTTGDGGIFSTVEDLAKWDRALYTDDLIPQDKLQKAFTPKVKNDGKETEYGYGWAIRRNESANRVYHGGGLSGFRTYIERDLDSKNTIIVLSNHSNSSGELSTAIRRILQNKTVEDSQ